MTRAKKTRSLKRIHQVKTGSKQKLKRAADNDRQTGKGKKKNLSVYEKHLLELEKKKSESGNIKPNQKSKQKETAQKSEKKSEEKEANKPSFKQEKSQKPVKPQEKKEMPEEELSIDEFENSEDDIFSNFKDNKDTF